MKKILFVFLSMISVSVMADTPSSRVSIFSTTVDWSAVTGLPLHQYTGEIYGKNKSLVKNGLVLYYLDSFPCYGEADSVRVWVSPNGKMSGHLRLVCVHKPDTISFAWRNADEEALDAKSTGILTCPIQGERSFSIDISKCEIGKNWTEYK
ncbi:MAG: hypothetical protein IKN73_00670 [Alphaproteobacteria bacterium]|nr:hypothetical protein [Alphaproteobacteria bacterium]